MDEVKISEDKEAEIILVTTTLSAVSGFIAATPIPIEWKAPIVAMTSTITAAILVYWKTKINNIP